MGGMRSGWLTFASVIMWITAGLHVIWALNLWGDAAWLADVSAGILGDQRWLWGLVDIGLAILFAYAAMSVAQGQTFGRTVAVIVSSVAILRWFYWMAFAPFLGLTIVVLMVLVLYGVLVTWGEEEAR